MPVTTTGVDESVMVPFPNWPEKLAPQQRTDPSVSRAQVWPKDPDTAATLVSPGTVIGIGELAFDPSPNSPLEFPPQQRSVPSTRTAQL
jgi:hypothetical protein